MEINQLGPNMTQDTQDQYLEEMQDTVDTLKQNQIEESTLGFFEDALQRADKLTNPQIKDEIFEKLETIITVIHHE